MGKRGRKTNQETQVLRQNVFSRPTFLDKIPEKGEKAKAIALLAEQLKQISSSECIAYKTPEFVEKFRVKSPINKELNYIRNQLKLNGVKKPRTADHEGTIYFWTGLCKKS